MRAVHSYQLFVLACILILAVLGVMGWYGASASPLRRALPWAARDIQENVVTNGPRYELLLTATLAESDFRQYLDRTGLTPHESGRSYGGDAAAALRWAPDQSRPAWWTPTDALDDTYVNEREKNWILAKWEQGRLFVRSFNE